MLQGYVNALIIGGLGVLCALAAWQRPRIERAVEWLLAPVAWLVELVKRRVAASVQRAADRERMNA